MRSSWIIQVDSKSSDKCPYERHTEERERAGGGHVTMEAKMGVMWPQAKESQESPAGGKDSERSSSGAYGGSMALLTP